MADEMHCTKCGAKLEPGSQFCPACGTPLGAMMGNASYQTAGSGGPDPFAYGLQSKLGTYAILTAIYGVLALLYGLFVIGGMGLIVDTYKEVYGTTLSGDIVMAVGAISVLSSVAAIAGAYLAKKCKMFTVTIVLYLVASITSICLTVITLVIGLVFTYLVFRCKPAFTS